MQQWSGTCTGCIVLLKLLTDTKHRAASLRQQGYLCCKLSRSQDAEVRFGGLSEASVLTIRSSSFLIFPVNRITEKKVADDFKKFLLLVGIRYWQWSRLRNFSVWMPSLITVPPLNFINIHQVTSVIFGFAEIHTLSECSVLCDTLVR